MLTLGSARAALVLYQNARAVTGAADHLSRYIVPLLRDWSASDLELISLLETLGRRGDALEPAITFLSQWTQEKGSTIGVSVYQARDTLHRIELFLDATSIRKKSTPPMSETEKETLVKQMKKYLRELDFLLASLNLAVSVATVSQPYQPKLPPTATITSSTSSSLIESEPPRYISPSCLLRASERLKSTGMMSGDLVVAYGSFYHQSTTYAGSFGAALKHAVETEPIAPVQAHPTARWLTPMSAVADNGLGGPANISATSEEWMTNETHFSPAFASTGPNAPIRTAEEPAYVATWTEGQVMKAGGLIEQDSDDWNQLVSPPAVQADIPPSQPASQISFSASHSTPISAPPPGPNTLSDWRQVYPAACMKIIRNGRRHMYELHITSLASSSSDGLTRPSSSTLKFDLTASLDFRSTSLRSLDLLQPSQSGLIDGVFAFEDRIANTLQNRFAFMLHSIEEPQLSSLDLPTSPTAAIPSATSTSSSSTSDSLRPLDIAYLSRLCMYENMHAESSASSLGSRVTRGSSDSFGTSLHHVQASDEELWLLLAGVHIYGETKEQLPSQKPQRPEQQSTSSSRDAGQQQ